MSISFSLSTKYEENLHTLATFLSHCTGSFDFRKVFNMSVKVYIFMKALTMKKFSYTLIYLS